jgi:hypothetical protein
VNCSADRRDRRYEAGDVSGACFIPNPAIELFGNKLFDSVFLSPDLKY